jgi:hypothetical protein
MDPFSIIALVCTGIICLAVGVLIGINIRIDRDMA